MSKLRPFTCNFSFLTWNSHTFFWLKEKYDVKLLTWEYNFCVDYTPETQD